MCAECITVPLPIGIWEIIDALLCMEVAKQVGLKNDPAVDQLGAKIKEMISECPTEDYLLRVVDRIRLHALIGG